MDFLVFQLQAPLAAWGDTAVGEFRPTQDAPGLSALVGLLGAALGLRREDEAAHAALRDGYGYAVGVQFAGRLLRDYHTAQVPGQASLKKRPHASRRDELALPRDELNTILSTRDYRQDAAWLVALQPLAHAPHSLADLAAALRCPRFVLYLGRKACPPAAPLFPLPVEAADAETALEDYRRQLAARIEALDEAPPRHRLPAPQALTRLIWSEGIHVGRAPDLVTTRKDRPIRRRGWQFGDRAEYVAFLQPEA